MVGGVGVMTVGNNNPFIWENIEKIWKARSYAIGATSYHNVASSFYHDLSLLTPGQKLTKAQTAGGGAEAIEGAIKLVKIANRNSKEKTKILSTLNAFHGKTTGAVSVGGKANWWAFQGGLILDQVTHVPYNDVAALEKGKIIFDAVIAVKNKYPGIIKDVRGRGCIMGVEFEDVPEKLVDKYGPNWAMKCERYFSEEFRIQILHSRPADYRRRKMTYTTVQPYFALESTYYFKKVIGSHPFSHFYQFRRDDKEKDVVAVPHGSMDIIFECDGRKPSGFVFGLAMDNRTLPLRSNKTYFGVRLLPGVVPLSIKHIAGKYTQGPRPLEIHIDRFRGLASSMSFPDKVEYFLAAYPKDDFAEGGLFSNLVRLILHSGGDISIKRIEHLTGYGRRYIHKVFSQNTAVCPKLFANVIRFQKAIQAINKSRYSSLSEIAIEMGYCDHSRFSQAFKQYMSITPREYIDVIRSRGYNRLIQEF